MDAQNHEPLEPAEQVDTDDQQEVQPIPEAVADVLEAIEAQELDPGEEFILALLLLNRQRTYHTDMVDGLLSGSEGEAEIDPSQLVAWAADGERIQAALETLSSISYGGGDLTDEEDPESLDACEVDALQAQANRHD